MNETVNWALESVTFRREKRERAFPPAKRCESSVNGGKVFGGAGSGRCESASRALPPFTKLSLRPTCPPGCHLFAVGLVLAVDEVARV